MLVFVLNKDGLPLMPCKPATARKLLKNGYAKVAKRKVFTIQLNFECENKVQDVTLGVDPGYKHVGLSAVSNDKELFSSEVELRTNIPKLLSEKLMYRRGRRNKLWYREPRFDNRGIPKGWLAPSVEHKLGSHIKAVEFIKSILPVTQINIEAAAFDIQKIKNPEISGTEYQNGEQTGFWNVREYVLYRDNHTCQSCNGKSKDKILNVHHIESRQTGGDRPDNLITLCEKCHKDYHAGRIELKIKKHNSFKAETIMSILRWKIVNKLRELGNTVNVTYGYLTKSARIALGLSKTHYNDAFCIAGGNKQERTFTYAGKQIRRNNRAIQLNRKGYKPFVRKVRYKLQPNDLVRVKNIIYKVKGVHSYGKAVKLADTLKNIINVNPKNVGLIKYGKGLQFNF
jgi:N6-L-threonylcarbamoyladenine synthase